MLFSTKRLPFLVAVLSVVAVGASTIMTALPARFVLPRIYNKLSPGHTHPKTADNLPNVNIQK